VLLRRVTLTGKVNWGQRPFLPLHGDRSSGMAHAQ